MKVITTNKLNRFWKKGIKPIIEELAKKFDVSRLANNLLTTEEGFGMDARQGPVIQGEIDEVKNGLSELYSKLEWKLIGAVSGGSAISHDFSKYREIFCVVKSGLTATVYELHIIKQELNSNSSLFVLPGVTYKGDAYGYVQRAGYIHASLSEIKVYQLWETTTSEKPVNALSYANIAVYAK